MEWVRGQATNQLTVQVPVGSVPLSELFEAMTGRDEAASGIVQWALRQTTMEEVFLHIARESEAQKAQADEHAVAIKRSAGAASSAAGCCGRTPIKV